MRILPPPGSGKIHPVLGFFALLVFVFLPFILIRLVVSIAVQSDEERMLEEYRRAMKSEMESFIQEAAPAYQLRNVLDRALRGLPIPDGRRAQGIDQTWAKRFQHRLKRVIPFAPGDLWVFGPDLKPLLIEETPPEHHRKAHLIYAYLCRLSGYVASHPEFIDHVKANYQGEGYHLERIMNVLCEKNAAVKVESAIGKTITTAINSLWGKFNLASHLREDLHLSSTIGSRNGFNDVIPLSTRVGRRYLGMVHWTDHVGRPLGGILVTFDEKYVTPAWILSETCRSSQHRELIRSWSMHKRGRREREWLSNRRGLHWIDLPAQMPEMQIGVTLPAHLGSHPFRPSLRKVDSFLGISLCALTVLFIVFSRTGVPLRIHGQLNAALFLVGLVPFLGFAVVAFSFLSMKTSFERRIGLRKAENALAEIQGHNRAFQGQLLRRCRRIRDRVSRLHGQRHLISPFLAALKGRRILSDYFVQLDEGFEATSQNPADKENVTAALMSGMVGPLFDEVVKQEGKAATGKEKPTNFKRSLTAETLLSVLLSPQHYSALMIGRNQLHKLMFGISNPAFVFMDLVFHPSTKTPAGVIFLSTTAHATVDEFLLQHLFRGGTSPHRALGLDRLIVRGFSTASYVCIPRNTPLTRIERELFQQVLGSRDRVSRDDFDGPDGGFSAAAPLEDSNYVLIGRIDGRDIRAKIGLLQIGVWVVLGYAVIVLVGIGSFLSGRFAVPLLTLREAAEQIEKGDLEIRLEIPRRDEFGDLATGFNRMTAGLRERSRMSRFVSASLLETVRREDQGDQDTVCRTDVTVLFSDLRGFTSLSEKHDAATIVDLLNDYFTEMESPIVEHGGDIDKYVGDAIMAVFRAHPGEPPLHHAVRACRAALRMREVLTAFNADRSTRGLFPVNNGIGINTGEVISGHVGSRHGRLDHTVIGDTVNLAARLESESKRGTVTNIIISAETREVLGSAGIVTPLDRVTVKGKAQPVEIFELVALTDGHNESPSSNRVGTTIGD